MKAAYYESFKGRVTIAQLPDPTPAANEVIVRVKATGLCRSDWHGWQGHDTDIHLPNVPGHELAGIIVATGNEIRGWKKDDRVTVPFCIGCGSCIQCSNGQQQICDQYYQPGFTEGRLLNLSASLMQMKTSYAYQIIWILSQQQYWVA